MNTKEKGDFFENISYSIIKQKLENSELGYIPSLAKVFKQKGYYSRDRESEIIFDISIEITLPGADNYFMLCLIECKNYNKNVPVDDLEEFHSKVSQVSGLNAKSIFITNKGFSRGAYRFARSKGISLMEINHNLTLNIILHKSLSTQQSKAERNYSESDLNIDDPIGKEILIRKLSRKLDSLILSGFIDYLKKTGQVNKTDLPRLSGEDIDEIALEILSEIQPSFLVGRAKLDLDNVITFIKETINYEVIFTRIGNLDSNGREIVASVDFDKRQILIDDSIHNSNRLGFILCHEFGHICLHNKLAISQDSYEAFEDHKYSFRLGKAKFTNPRQWIEWQANRFASSMLMPPKIFEAVCRAVFDENGRRTNEPLYVDDNKYSQDDFHKIIYSLALFFNTTKTSIIYKMHSLNLINDNTNTKRISKILKEEYPALFNYD